MPARISLPPLTPAQQEIVLDFRRRWKIMGLVLKTLPGIYSALRHTLDDDDIEQLAYLGVCRAAQLFDPARGVKFGTYVVYWIRAACGRYLTAQRRGKRTGTVFSGVDWESLMISMPDTADDIDTLDEFRSAGDRVDDVLRRLSERDRTVVEMRFGLNGRPRMTLKQVSENIGVPRERVRQIQERAISRMRIVPPDGVTVEEMIAASGTLRN
jgi:RNA polymerase sporulation-specific sigma factor